MLPARDDPDDFGKYSHACRGFTYWTVPYMSGLLANQSVEQLHAAWDRPKC